MSIADKYSILSRLGTQQHRKFNDVFLVQQKSGSEKAVMKVLSKTDRNMHLQERLRQEAAFDFRHPGLPETRDFFESDTELMLVRSYVEGVPLDEWMKRIKRKEKAASLLLFLEALAPLLAVMREAGIVHLDLKPGNMLVQQNGDSLSVSLIDFGMALHIGDTTKRSTLFPLGYAAPELLLNRLHLADHPTDLFALGISLWQCFTGKLPLLHPNPSITTNLQLTHPLPEDDAIPKRIFPILAKLCTKHSFSIPPNKMDVYQVDVLLKAAMKQRYSSLEEVISDWKQAVEIRKWWMWR